MANALAVIVAAAMASVVGPVVMALLQRRVRLEDWARQDEVASRLMARQDQQTRAQGAVARSLAASDRRAAAASEAAAEQLGQIHKLVNSNLTEALRGQLAATVGHVAALRRVLGDPPDPADVEAIATLETAVDRMTTDLRDRDAAAERVDEQP